MPGTKRLCPSVRNHHLAKHQPLAFSTRSRSRSRDNVVSVCGSVNRGTARRRLFYRVNGTRVFPSTTSTSPAARARRNIFLLLLLLLLLLLHRGMHARHGTRAASSGARAPRWKAARGQLETGSRQGTRWSGIKRSCPTGMYRGVNFIFPVENPQPRSLRTQPPSCISGWLTSKSERLSSRGQRQNPGSIPRYVGIAVIARRPISAGTTRVASREIFAGARLMINVYFRCVAELKIGVEP